MIWDYENKLFLITLLPIDFNIHYWLFLIYYLIAELWGKIKSWTISIQMNF